MVIKKLLIEAKNLLNGREPKELSKEEVDNMSEELIVFLNRKPDGRTYQEWFESVEMSNLLFVE